MNISNVDISKKQGYQQTFVSPCLTFLHVFVTTVS